MKSINPNESLKLQVVIILMVIVGVAGMLWGMGKASNLAVSTFTAEMKAERDFAMLVSGIDGKRDKVFDLYDDEGVRYILIVAKDPVTVEAQD